MSRNNQVYDFVVVGGGAFGVSTALYLCLQYPKAKCALVEQFKFGHGEGSSHSEIRIIRSTYNNPFYRDLCLQGMSKNWPQVQKLLGQQLIVTNPFVAYIQCKQEYQKFKEVANTSNNIKELPIQQVRQKYPYAPFVQIKTAFVQEKAGVVMAERYLSNAIKFLRTCTNIDLIEDTEVLAVSNVKNSVILKLKDLKTTYSITAKKVSLSCGRWIGRLVPETKTILHQVRQTIAYWKMKNPNEYKIGKFPCWLHLKQDSNMYGLPDASGVGIKYAFHYQDPETELKFQTEQEYVKFKTEQLYKRSKSHFPNGTLGLNKIQKCYYTVTKTEDFVIDWTDQNQNVLICSPCSGHGFKFGPIIGKIVADLLEKDQSIQIFQKYRHLTRLFFHLGVNLQ